MSAPAVRDEPNLDPKLANGIRKIRVAAAQLATKFPEEFPAVESVSSANGNQLVWPALLFQELEICVQKAEAGKKEDPHWADVIVDIVISLMSRSSGTMNKLLEKGMIAVARHVTPAVAESFVAALSDNNPFDDDENDDDEEEDDEEEDKDEDDDEEEDEDYESEAEEDMAEIDKFKEKLQSILAENGPEGDDDIVLDDDAMEGLDEALGEAFKERIGSSKKEEDKKSKRELESFRCRVLSLFCSLLQKRDIELEIVLPVLAQIAQFLSTVSDSGLTSKTVTVLKQISKIKTGDRKAPKELAGILKQYLDIASKPLNQNIEPAVHSVIEWMLRLGDKSKKCQKVTDESVSHLVDRCVKKEKLHPLMLLIMKHKRIPDSKFDEFWSKISASVVEQMSVDKPRHEIAAQYIVALSQLKKTPQGEGKIVDSELQSALTKIKKSKLKKPGWKALKSLRNESSD